MVCITKKKRPNTNYIPKCENEQQKTIFSIHTVANSSAKQQNNTDDNVASSILQIKPPKQNEIHSNRWNFNSYLASNFHSDANTVVNNNNNGENARNLSYNIYGQKLNKLTDNSKDNSTDLMDEFNFNKQKRNNIRGGSNESNKTTKLLGNLQDLERSAKNRVDSHFWTSILGDGRDMNDVDVINRNLNMLNCSLNSSKFTPSSSAASSSHTKSMIPSKRNLNQFKEFTARDLNITNNTLRLDYNDLAVTNDQESVDTTQPTSKEK